MEIRVLRQHEVKELLPMGECIDLMAKAMTAVSEGKAVLPLRTGMKMPGDIGMFGIMPGYLGAPEAFGIKLVSLFPRNAGTEYSSHLGVVMLFEVEHGQPIALLDGAEITAIRTAAASGFATRLLAREDAGDLAIIGTGEQAVVHLEAMACVRKLRRVRVWGRAFEKAKAFARKQGERFGLEIEPMENVQDTVRDADLICTVTFAPEPILFGEWVSAGAHLNVVGSSVATTAEIDTDLVVKSKFFVDYRESTVNQGGEYRRALEAGVITPEHILAEIGEVQNGSKPGRQAQDEITLYKSLGVAAQDLASAHYILEKARARNIGQTVDF